MSDQDLQLNVADGIATITLNRPPLNVLNNEMMAQFNAFLESVLAHKDVAAIVIRAEGKAFSAGVDVADHTADRVAEMIHLFHGIFRKLVATDVLSIAVVQGAALGGGCELACVCDVVLASERAKFGQPEIQVGVFPPVAACLFPHQLGIKKAVELNVLGITVGAAEAQQFGLVNQVYPVEQFDGSVNNYLEQISKLSRPVLRIAKKATVLAYRRQFLEQLEQTEQLYLGELMKLPDAHEGIAAFMGKREPQWTHQ